MVQRIGRFRHDLTYLYRNRPAPGQNRWFRIWIGRNRS